MNSLEFVFYPQKVSIYYDCFPKKKALTFYKRAYKIVAVANQSHLRWRDFECCNVFFERNGIFVKVKNKLLLILLAMLLGFTGCGVSKEDTDGKLTVYTSFYPMADFVSKVGGDRVKVVNMVPAGTEPHDWEPSAADIMRLEEAKVFVYNGAGLEHWVEDVLSALQNKELMVVEASKGIVLLERKEDDDHGHDHGAVDPHVWLDPRNVKIEAENIRDALIEADAEGAEIYRANFDRFAAELDALDQDFRESLSAVPQKHIVVAHEAFSYLCAAYGLEQIGIEGLSPDSEPSPARMAEIIAFAKEYEIKTNFFEEQVSSKVAQTIADEIGAQTHVLSPFEGMDEGDYLTVMARNLETLKEVLA